MNYEPVIGLEVHVQLGTKSKIFCACPVEFGAEPNKNTCPVCLGWPGSLPVLNRKALDFGIKIGLALNCEINERLKFDRKNYFYPDLPKAYQISQFDQPVNGKGWIQIEFKDAKGQIQKKKIGVTRAHLEEDAGKLLHEGIKDGSLVDYNRAGTPLLEIVSEPDMRSAEEAYAYLTALKAIVQYLGVSDCDMEKGQLRCDANVSIRPVGQEKFGTKAEVKNLNSFKAVQKAIQYEIERHTKILNEGGKISQETRLWNDDSGTTSLMRSKEDAHDYRYFPEPDLVPFTISLEAVDAIRKTLPELPVQQAERFVNEFKLSPYDSIVLVQEKERARFFESTTAGTLRIFVAENIKVTDEMKVKVSRSASTWIQSELLALLNEKNIPIEQSPVNPDQLAGLIHLMENNTISGKIAKDVLPLMFETGSTADAIVKEKGWVQVTDTKVIEEAADKVIAANEKSVTDFKAGKQAALGFLVGQLMKATQGKANPKLANEILLNKLSAD